MYTSVKKATRALSRMKSSKARRTGLQQRRERYVQILGLVTGRHSPGENRGISQRSLEEESVEKPVPDVDERVLKRTRD